jgi:hypothetical protein
MSALTQIPWWGWILLAVGAAWFFFRYLWIVAAIVIMLLLGMLALVAVATLMSPGTPGPDDPFQHPD